MNMLLRNNKAPTIYYLIVTLKYFSLILFVIGIIINLDGLKILFKVNQYREGYLQLDSLFAGKGPEERNSTYYAIGHVNKVNTTVIIGTAGTKFTDSVIQRVSDKSIVYLPVWYKSDGQLTIEKFPHEKSFPHKRIYAKLILFLVLFNGPFIALWIWQWQIKKKF